MNNTRTPSKPTNPLSGVDASGGELGLSFITDFVDPITIPIEEQYIRNGPFIAKVFLTFNPMSWLAEIYPNLLAPDAGLPLLLTMFTPPDTPLGDETPWYWVSCRLHPYQLEFPRTEELESEKFALALPWEGGVDLYDILPIRFHIGNLC